VVRALGSAATKMESRVDPFKRAKPSYTRGVESGPTKASAGEGGLTYDEAIQAVSDFVSADERFVVVSDTSLSMYPAADIAVKGADAYVCNGVWQAIGFSVAAAVGVGLAHTRRPLVICGDGGFQMTAPAISTMARHRIKSVVLVLDNGHYGIEQFLLDRSYFTNAANTVRPYLALPSWDYVALAKAWGAPFARRVETRADLDAALKAAGDANGPALLSVRIRAHDLPSAVRA
jgi:indolepyruvate decarboxylase